METSHTTEIGTHTTLFVEEEILLNSSENGLQFKVYTLININAKFSMEVNTGETKIMTFRRMEPIGSRICIDDRMLNKLPFGI
jgi:hypothetical protein